MADDEDSEHGQRLKHHDKEVPMGDLFVRPAPTALEEDTERGHFNHCESCISDQEAR